MRRRSEVGKDDDTPSLPPLATGIALGIWILVMLTLALVVVPTIFGSCLGGTPAT